MKEERALPPVLIADDNPDDLFLLKHNLHIAGIKNPVLTFDNGTELVDFLKWFNAIADLDRAVPPCVLFLDIRMPGFDGFRVLAWAKAQDVFAPLRVVMVSGSSDPKNIDRASAMGAERYLTKPVAVATLRTVLRECGCLKPRHPRRAPAQRRAMR